MRVSFAPGTETLRVPWGTPRPVRFHDAELDLDLAVRARGFAEIEEASIGDRDERFRQIRMAAAAALKTQLETDAWPWSALDKERERLEEALEEALTAQGLRASLRFDSIVPNEETERALREKLAGRSGAALPDPPVDSPMIDGPGAWPPADSGGFGLWKVGETPPAPEDRRCPNCGKKEPFYAKYCTQCGTKLTN